MSTAFVLGGGGLLGAVEVGMLRALFEADVRPDLILGTSVGALNGALVAADPGDAVIDRLLGLWQSAASTREVYGDGPVRQVTRAVRTGTHLHSAKPLRDRLVQELGELTFADLAVPFQCCAARIEDASEHWFAEGRVTDAVMASAAVPGLLRPAEVGGQHYLDGGIVNSIPVGRAVECGATTIYVLQVGRVDRPLKPPTKPWEVARVSFEIARRHRFHREMAALPEHVTAHVLPTGAGDGPGGPGPGKDSLLGYRDFTAISRRIDTAYDASSAYLREHG
ncbi:patatin-like phospholipase family protein [Nocardioides panacis]|uniref:Patatin-like phospholipase family protein n=1 Tax=Nocardioides panacis TaxID=2849501 RepID=A0A975SXB7_9ACTN|nr:patatin-like phospholipase family protein [Nocardioides panacis]QWZ07663.1 patatin-like phospholipase family protein [Nocardioides panacis]